MSTHTSLHGVSRWGESLLSDQLEANLASFFEWAFLGAGGFVNVSYSASGAYGGRLSRLRLGDDPNYLTGQVWEGFRRDWVWQSGVECSFQPTRVSGVYVGGSFQPATGVGAYAHKVDYPNGRVIFSSPIASGSVVNCEFSYRACHVTTADSLWWREVQFSSLRADDPHFLAYGSGAWATMAQSRVQLPVVVVEAQPQARRYGTAVGGGQTVAQEVHLHVLAETPYERKFLHDAVTYQWWKRLQSFDKNLLFSSNRYPLDADGHPNPSGLMYPDLVRPSGEGGCGWRQIRVTDVQSSAPPARVTAPLYTAHVRAVCEVDLP